MEFYWVLFEILPYIILVAAVIACVIVWITPYHQILSKIYFGDGPQPVKTISRMLAAYTVLCWGFIGVFAFQDFLFRRTTECCDKDGFYCYLISDGAIESVQDCNKISDKNSIVCYEIVLDVFQGLGKIAAYGALLFNFIGIPKLFNWNKWGIALATAFATMTAMVVLYYSIIKRLAELNLLLAIQPVMFSTVLLALMGLFWVILAWIGCGYNIRSQSFLEGMLDLLSKKRETETKMKEMNMSEKSEEKKKKEAKKKRQAEKREKGKHKAN